MCLGEVTLDEAENVRSIRSLDRSRRPFSDPLYAVVGKGTVGSHNSEGRPKPAAIFRPVPGPS